MLAYEKYTTSPCIFTYAPWDLTFKYQKKLPVSGLLFP